MEREELIKILKLLTEGLENASLNEELDKLKGECKSWKNAYFYSLTVSIMLYKKMCVDLGGLAYFSIENFQREVQKLIDQFDDPILIEDAKLLFEASTGEKYNES